MTERAATIYMIVTLLDEARTRLQEDRGRFLAVRALIASLGTDGRDQVLLPADRFYTGLEAQYAQAQAQAERWNDTEEVTYDGDTDL